MTQADYVQRLRLRFSKHGPARFTSHLDLARSLERSFIRAAIPVAYSQGFNRRPRMQFAGALPLGVTSDCELADIWLTQKLLPDRLLGQLNAKIAPGIVVIEVSEAPLEEAALQTQTTSATYQASLLNKIARSDLLQRIESLLSSQSLLIERKRGKKVKRFDIRPLILELSLKEWSPQRTTLHMRLSMLPGKTGRADDVLAAIGLDPLSASIKRTEIRLLPKRQAIP